MPDWQWNRYQGIDPNLLQSQVNAPSKNAAGLSALSQGLFGNPNQANAGIYGIVGQIQQMAQKRQQQKQVQDLINQMMAQQGGIQGSAGGGFGSGQTQAPTGGNTVTLEDGTSYVNMGGQWYKL